MLTRSPAAPCSVARKQRALHAPTLLASLRSPSAHVFHCKRARPAVAWAAHKPAVSSAADGDAVLSWSFTEPATTGNAATADAGAATRSQQAREQPIQQKQAVVSKKHNRQPRQQQQQEQTRQRAQRTRKHQPQRAPGSLIVGAQAAAPSSPNGQPTQQQHPKTAQTRRLQQQDSSTTDNRKHSSSSTRAKPGSSASHHSQEPDPYRDAQRRVRAVLAAADPLNPAAAAQRLSDTINDLTIALQLLATARRPTNLTAYRQYEAAVQQLATAVLQKYKQLLLRLLPQQQQQPTQPPPGGPLLDPWQQQQQIAAALASLPGTKVAAAAFSLGVLRLYDKELVSALETGSLQLMGRGAFKPNQLGQLVQGFVYLDHQPSPEWHLGFLKCTKRHLASMQAPQLDSLAVWLIHYGLCGGSSSSTAASGLAVILPGQGALQLAAAAATRAVGVAGTASSAAVVQPNAAWVQAYLAAVGNNASSFKPVQLVQVLQAAAALQQQQQGLQGLGSSWDSAQDRTAGSTPDYSSSSGSGAGISSRQRMSLQALDRADDSKSWAGALVAAVQQQLPELTMAHLAAALPALLLLTQPPWSQQQQQYLQLLQPLLLQVKVLLPSCAGRDLVVVIQAVAHLAGPGALAAEREWCDAVLVQLHAQLPTLGPSELAGVVNAIALMQVKPYKAWVAALCERLRVDARVMDATQVLVVLEGLAAVHIQLDSEVLHVFEVQIKKWMGSWGVEELDRVVGALRGMYPRVLPGRTVCQLVDELQRRQQYLALQEQQQAQLFG